jgi:dihydroflavonol-4-reductase
MILVTGAAGHVGNVLIRKLVLMGEQVRALVLPGEDLKSLEGLSVEKVEGNVLNLTSLEEAMKDVNLVFHLAGIIAIMPGQEEIMQMVNVEGVKNVVNAALKTGVNRLVHVSSIHAFKRMPHGIVIDEKTPFDPKSPAGTYDKTKAEGTLAVLDGVKRGLDAVIACPTGIIGPYDFRGSEMGQLIRSFMQKKLSFLVHGAYDFVDVRDVVDGLILAAEKGRSGEAYILSGKQTKINQIKEITQKIIGIKSPVLFIPMKLALFSARFTELFYRIAKKTPKFTTYSLKTVQDNSMFSHAKAGKELGYTPRTLEETLSDTIHWIKRQQPQIDFGK